ncbi:lysylphosphatidylglycerol synthase domain-containing protein [Streptomyces phaeoluteigriseus]|uniref:Lysylphosphatidylglycerol synthase domain-containing protein n=1 Tax=Streptomyces phaeoluteigriseus TaxID=114686 RepID=A0ABY4Z7S5_9ACTN|nr:lysylphosphatidylglycerol synthase domain-containing protein [Streptomyces phaeoluteigriseus]USQ84917.1 lysylphosphatidylglycerol synthase domain-containing protein [Streptomyces phaeoluteigriseus]
MTSERISVGAGRGSGTYWRTALTLAVLVAAVWLAHRHWPVLHTGAVRLAGADRRWLLAAAVAASGTWLCAAVAQQGSVVPRLPPGPLVAAQFAASAANHLLPAGLGAGAVNVRFLMRRGLTAGHAATAVAVKATAGAVARVGLLAVFAAACPGLLRLPSGWGGWAAVAAVAVGAVLLAAARHPRCRAALTTVWADVKAVHALPRRALALWGGSLAFAALHACVLISVTRAVGLPLPAPEVALLYLAASGAAALLPTPGGIGSLDAALGLALVTAGAPAEGAASAVLGYRLWTLWLPLLPGLLVLGVLVRRRSL